MRRLDPAPRADRITQPHSNEWLQAVTERLGVIQLTADPTPDEVPNNQWVLCKNSSSGSVDFWFNDNGTMRKVNLTTGTPSTAAVDVTFTPAGDIAATDVQAALEELDTEKEAAGTAAAAVAELFYARRFLLMGA